MDQNSTPPATASPATKLQWIFQSDTQARVTEGWTYTAEETAEHGETEHNAIDIGAPHGTPVYSPIKGRVFGGIQISHRRRPDGKIRGYGAGYFVEIVAPDGLRVQLMHLSRIAPNIPIESPVKKDAETWSPFPNGPLYPSMVREIDAGTLVGYVGHSGLSKDVIETVATLGKVPSWDEDHVHLWVGYRDDTGSKSKYIDPFNLYSPDLTAYNKAVTGKANDMWHRSSDGLLQYR